MIGAMMKADVAYCIDQDDRIREVSPTWALVAERTPQPDALSPERLIGRVLWECVSDPTTISIYRLVVSLARRGRDVTFTFRCDSPDARRRFLMHVTPEAGGLVRFVTHEVEGESYADPPPDASGTDGLAGQMALRICSWCERVQSPSGEWLEPDSALRQLRWFEEPHPPEITHVMCEPCEDTMRRMVAEWTGDPRGEPSQR
jgi:hypothetical protein